jgi:hypothetical protein
MSYAVCVVSQYMVYNCVYYCMLYVYIHDTYLRRAPQQRDGAVPPLLEVWAPGADLLHDDVEEHRCIIYIGVVSV